MSGHTDRKEESDIISLLARAERVELNCALTQLDTAALFNDVDDHFAGPKNKTALLNLLGKKRLRHLGVEARASVVHGLQVGWTTLSENDDKPKTPEPKSGGIEEQTIRNIFVGTEGSQLTQLKNAVNAGADQYDMHSLLFSDVDDAGLVADMFEHISQEGIDTPNDPLKPLSDIDDTFISGLKDKRFPKGTIYPGVLAFYDELDRGTDESDPLGDLTFITARPGEVTGTVKSSTHRTLRSHGVREAAALFGSLTGLISHEAMAAKKMENFTDYSRIYPEYDFAWIGDSGQGDALLGEMMLAEYPDKVKGVFIHDVIGLTPSQREEMKSKGIQVFDTYVGAAVDAHGKGLISREGLQRVVDSSRDGFAEISWDSDAQKTAAYAMLQKDIDNVSGL